MSTTFDNLGASQVRETLNQFESSGAQVGALPEAASLYDEYDEMYPLNNSFQNHGYIPTRGSGREVVGPFFTASDIESLRLNLNTTTEGRRSAIQAHYDSAGMISSISVTDRYSSQPYIGTFTGSLSYNIDSNSKPQDSSSKVMASEFEKWVLEHLDLNITANQVGNRLEVKAVLSTKDGKELLSDTDVTELYIE